MLSLLSLESFRKESTNENDEEEEEEDLEEEKDEGNERWSMNLDKDHVSDEFRTVMGTSPQCSRRYCQLNSRGSQS